MKYFYGIIDHGQDTFDPTWTQEYDNGPHKCHITDYVLDLAEEVFHEHDGWEATWPLTFRLWDEAGEFVADYEVDIENEPRFYVNKVKNYANTVHGV